MSKKNETATANNANTVNTNEILAAAKQEQADKEPKLSPYATNAMRPVIIQKSLDGFKRAINLKRVEDEGLEEVTLEQWKYNVRKLYEAACEYSRAIGTPDEDTRKQEVWEVWKTIIAVGEEDRFHPNMYIRPLDVENLRVLAAESAEEWVRGVGFVPTVTGEVAFRNKIEIRLALRIAGNKTLNDRQRTVLKDYQKAERMIKAAENLINGYTQGKVTVASLDAQIADAQKELDSLKDVLKAANVKDIDKLTKKQEAAIKTLKEQKAAAEERLKKYTKQKRDNQAAYDAIIASLDAIEGASKKEDVPKSNETKAETAARIAAEMNK